jgi:hypothetical protein
MTAELAAAAPARVPLCTTEGDPEDWFPVHKGGRPPRSWYARVDETKAICARCPVADWCLAEFGDQPHGIIAGLLPEERGWPSKEMERVYLALRLTGDTTGPGAEATEAGG